MSLKGVKGALGDPGLPGPTGIRGEFGERVSIMCVCICMTKSMFITQFVLSTQQYTTQMYKMKRCVEEQVSCSFLPINTLTPNIECEKTTKSVKGSKY